VAFTQRLDDRLDLVVIIGRREGFRSTRQAVVVARRHAQGVADQGHHVVDFTDHARADLVDAVGGLDLGKVGFVDLFEIGLGQLAVARQRLVDDLVEGRIVSGRIDVPDFIIAGDSGLPERLDLAKRHFREGQCAFVFVEHLHVPKIASVLPVVPNAISRNNAIKLTDESERPVNGFHRVAAEDKTGFCSSGFAGANFVGPVLLDQTRARTGRNRKAGRCE